MKRFFAFGCSYTAYIWSTWADIVGSTFDEYQNWGMSGGGNFFIFASLMEAHQKHKFTSDDTIIVCWTNVTRDDRYVESNWQSFGNVFTQPLLDKKWVDKNIQLRGCMIRDIACIAGASHFLRQIDAHWKYISMVPLTWSDQYSTDPVTKLKIIDVIECYEDIMRLIGPSFSEVLTDRIFLPFDLHPSPQDHLDYVDTVLPEYNISQTTRLQIAEEESKIRSNKFNKSMKAYNIQRL